MIRDLQPDLVVVFGGMADGDTPIGPASSSFFARLTKAAPKAKIVALSPVMTKQGQLGWIVLHRRSVRAAAIAIGGRFVDVGLPGFSSGTLSTAGQKAVARKVIAALG